MGIVGFGRIGRHVAEIAIAMGMRVIAADAGKKEVPDWPGFRWCDVDELMAAADVVSLHCPLLPQTRGIVNASSLSKMRPSSFLINTSRGPLVVEQDLADALNHGRLAGAAVDVLSSEPPPLDNPLLRAKSFWKGDEGKSAEMALRLAASPVKRTASRAYCADPLRRSRWCCIPNN
jgi:glycerate dehydrogenase